MAKRVLLDQDSLDSGLFEALVALGWDVLRTSDIGFERTSDDSILKWAAGEGRILYTANTADFARLSAEVARAGQTHAGIITRTLQQLPVGAQIRALQNLDDLYAQDEIRGQVLFLESYL